MDSIIARPTNKGRVIVVAASGCCASELNAVATARPSPSAGPILPRAIVRPAVTIEAIAMSVVLSIVRPFVVGVLFHSLGSASALASGLGSILASGLGSILASGLASALASGLASALASGVGLRLRVAAAMYTVAKIKKM